MSPDLKNNVDDVLATFDREIARCSFILPDFVAPRAAACRATLVRLIELNAPDLIIEGSVRVLWSKIDLLRAALDPANDNVH